LPPQLVLEVQVAGKAGVPIDAVGAVVHVTVTRPARAGYVTVFPCTAMVPDASNLNFAAGADVANTVLAPLSSDGTICVVTSAVTDVVVDVFGYVPAGSPIELLDSPVRGLDSRSGLGVERAGRVAGGSSIVFDAGAVAGVGEAGAVVLNVTATGPAGAGFVTVAACDVPAPATSSLNVVAGRDVANFVVSAVDDDGAVCVTTSVETNLVVDVAGRVAGAASDPVLLTTPERVVDSRNGTGTIPAPWTAGETRTITIDSGSVRASTAFVNLTATRAAAAGFVALHPCGVVAEGSTLNFRPGVDVANGAAVAVGANGTFCATASAPVDLIVDYVGAAADAGTIVTFDGVRVYDSRRQAARGCGLGVVHPAHDTLWVVDLDDGHLVAAVTSDQFVPFFEPRFEFLPAVITPRCDQLIVAAASGDQRNTAHALRVTFDGTVTDLGTLDYQTLRPTVAVLADGTPVWIVNDPSSASPPQILSVSSRAPLFVSNPYEFIRGLLDDDAVLTGGPESTWQITPIGESEPTRTAHALGDVSPGGIFQMIQPVSRTDPFTIVTFDGHVVQVRDFADLADPADYFWTGVWIDDGVVALCARGVQTRTFVWNIFSEPVELPLAACILDGR
jgi:hypothetical protein